VPFTLGASWFTMFRRVLIPKLLPSTAALTAPHFLQTIRKTTMTNPNLSYGPRGGPEQLFFLKDGTPRRPWVERGEGIYRWDTQGRRYIDASSGPITANIGHANPRVIEASERQIRKAAYASRVFFENDANIALADIVASLSGPGLERAFFVSGGSEANERAMKMARQYAITQGPATRWKVLSRNPGVTFLIPGRDTALGLLGAMPESVRFVSGLRFVAMVRQPVQHVARHLDVADHTHRVSQKSP